MESKTRIQRPTPARATTTAPRPMMNSARGFAPREQAFEQASEQERTRPPGPPFRFGELNIRARSGPPPSSPIIAQAQREAQALRPPGSRAMEPLPEATRARMEHTFGRGFHDVRVHPSSPRAGGPIHALTEGRDLHFAPGRYRPGTQQGDWLIGHELAHVVQQRRSGRPMAQAFAPRPLASPMRDALEAEANRAASDAAAGRRATVLLRAPLGAAQAFSAAEPHAAPDAAQGAPEDALGQLGGLRPDRLAGALGGVQGAVAADVAQDRSELAQTPPGSTSTAEDAQAAAAEGNAKDSADVQAAPMPRRGAGPRNSVARPGATNAAGSGRSAIKTQGPRASRSRHAAPSSRAATRAGASPKLAMSGQAATDAQEQRARLEQTVTKAHASAQKDITRPAGEDAIAPTVPQPRLRARIEAGGTGKGAPAAAPQAGATAQAGGQAGSRAGNEEDGAGALGIIAQHTKGAEIEAAVAKAQADMAAQRQAQAEAESQKRAQADQQIASMKDQAKTEQEQARQSARSEVERVRGEWQSEVDGQSEAARAEADREVKTGIEKVETEQDQANTEAERHMREGEDKAAAEERKGEQKAEQEKQKSEQESGGFLGWAKSAVSDFVNALKATISDIIEAARKAARRFIEAAKKLATAAIERARQAIVATLQAVGRAVTAIGDRLLAGFPALRARFRKTMQDLVSQATATVNQIAGKLQRGVQAALDQLGQGLDAALGLLEKGLHAIVDGVGAVVQAAIQHAGKIVQAFGAFAVLIKDIAADPGGWLTKLGAAVVDGIQNHLWKALKQAVTAWFHSKLMEILGIGGMVIELLRAGGMDLGAIGKMAWEGLKDAIPAALIAILVEKLVSMIVPAAGALIAILEGLQAAWGTVSRILTALDTFMAFLRAVETGNAGPLFARALAAAAVVVIDFVANWLLRKLRKAASKVSGKLKALAQKFRRRRNSRHRKPGRDHGRGPAPRRQRGREDKQDQRVMARWRKGISAVHRLMDSYRRYELVPRRRYAMRLKAIKIRYRFTRLALIRSGSRWFIDARMNPSQKIDDSNNIEDESAIPAPPDAIGKVTREFRRSNRGNKRYYAHDEAGNEWFYVVKRRGWQAFDRSHEKAREAEQAARAWLNRNVQRFRSVVEKHRDPWKPGLDAAGVGAVKDEAGNPEEKSIIGEAKTSAAVKGGYTYEYSAVTDNLSSNIEQAAKSMEERPGGAAIAEKFLANIQNGQVIFYIFLHGNAKLSEPYAKQLKEQILQELREYLQTRHKLSPKEAKRIAGRARIEKRKV